VAAESEDAHRPSASPHTALRFAVVGLVLAGIAGSELHLDAATRTGNLDEDVGHPYLTLREYLLSVDALAVTGRCPASDEKRPIDYG